MSELNKIDFENKYNDPTSGLYKDNVSRDINESRVRELVEDIKDSIFFNESTRYFGAITDAQYTAISPKQAGDIYYSTTTNTLKFYNGTTVIDTSFSASDVYSEQNSNFNASAINTVYGVDSSGGDIGCTLAVSSVGQYTIHNLGSGIVNILGTINGDVNPQIFERESFTIYYTGTENILR